MNRCEVDRSGFIGVCQVLESDGVMAHPSKLAEWRQAVINAISATDPSDQFREAPADSSRSPARHRPQPSLPARSAPAPGALCHPQHDIQDAQVGQPPDPLGSLQTRHEAGIGEDFR